MTNSDKFSKQLERDIKSPKFTLADKMLELMSDGKTRWASDISEILEVDVIDVIEVFDVLHKEGKLFIDGSFLNNINRPPS